MLREGILGILDALLKAVNDGLAMLDLSSDGGYTAR